jgi:hypothetical protein
MKQTNKQKQQKTWPGSDTMTTCIQVQYPTTELTHIMSYCYWFTVLEEDIKNTWYV